MSQYPYYLWTMGILVVCTGMLLPICAQAEPADSEHVAAGQKLYNQALEEFDARNYEAACRNFEKVTRLLPEALGAKMMLAECYEAQGKLTSAYLQYTQVDVLAQKAVDPKRVEKARERAAALEPRLATLVVDVPAEIASIPGISMTLDETRIAPEQWGAPLPVDAGTHEIAMSIPGRQRWAKRVEVHAEAERLHVSVETNVFEQVPQPAETTDALKQAQPSKAPQQAQSSKAQRSSLPMALQAPQRAWQQPLGIRLMAAGALGAVVGTILGGMALADDTKTDSTLGTASAVAFVMSLPLLAGGAVLTLRAPSRSVTTGVKVSMTLAPRAWVRVGPGMMAIGGAW